MTATINISEIAKPASAAAAILVTMQGLDIGKEIELTFWEDDTDAADALFKDPKDKTVQKIGKIKGTVAVLQPAQGTRPALLTLKDTTATQEARSNLSLVVAFAQPDGKKATSHELKLPNGAADVHEGESWEIFCTVAETAEVISPTTKVARIRRALSVAAGEATYSWHAGNLLKFYHDGAEEPSGTKGYFRDVAAAITNAREFIFIADWSFHPRMRLLRSSPPVLSDTVGAFLLAQAIRHPEMLVVIHTWDHTNVGAPDAENDDGNTWLDRIARAQFALKKRPANVLWQATSRTGIGFSHHQKFLVMDEPIPESTRLRLRAFIGGLDLTKGRFDWPDHAIQPAETGAPNLLAPLVFVANGAHTIDDWYSLEFFGDLDQAHPGPTLPRQPWHDIAAQIVGPTCYDLVREFVGRSQLSPSIGGNTGDTDSGSRKTIMDKFERILTAKQDPAKPYHFRNNPLVFTQQWDPAGGPWASQVLRSQHREHWEQKKPLRLSTINGTRSEFRWTVNGDFERSILLSNNQAIRQAENYVYIETQYFISSGAMWGRPRVANTVAQSLADRAVELGKAGRPFHIYLVLPMFPEGNPGDDPNGAQRLFQWNTVRSLARRIEAGTGKPFSDFLSVFFCARWEHLGALPGVGGTREANVIANKRYQIYVHSKFMMIDDRFMTIGSANLNERSMNGNRDSEIAIALWPNDDRFIEQCRAEALAFRRSIWREHLGPKFPPPDFENPASPRCIAAVQAAALENYKAFREGRHDAAVHGHLCMWPLEMDESKPPIKTGVSLAPEGDDFIPDRPATDAKGKALKPADLEIWRFHAPISNKFTGTFPDTIARIAE